MKRLNFDILGFMDVSDWWCCMNYCICVCHFIEVVFRLIFWVINSEDVNFLVEEVVNRLKIKSWHSGFMIVFWCGLKPESK